MCTIYIQCLQGPEEDIGSSGPGVTDGYGPISGHWELNLCPLENQSIFLATKPFLQPPYIKLKTDGEPSGD